MCFDRADDAMFIFDLRLSTNRVKQHSGTPAL